MGDGMCAHSLVVWLTGPECKNVNTAVLESSGVKSLVASISGSL